MEILLDSISKLKSLIGKPILVLKAKIDHLSLTNPSAVLIDKDIYFKTKRPDEWVKISKVSTCVDNYNFNGLQLEKLNQLINEELTSISIEPKSGAGNYTEIVEKIRIYGMEYPKIKSGTLAAFQIIFKSHRSLGFYIDEHDRFIYMTDNYTLFREFVRWHPDHPYELYETLQAK